VLLAKANGSCELLQALVRHGLVVRAALTPHMTDSMDRAVTLGRSEHQNRCVAIKERLIVIPLFQRSGALADLVVAHLIYCPPAGISVLTKSATNEDLVSLRSATANGLMLPPLPVVIPPRVPSPAPSQHQQQQQQQSQTMSSGSSLLLGVPTSPLTPGGMATLPMTRSPSSSLSGPAPILIQTTSLTSSFSGQRFTPRPPTSDPPPLVPRPPLAPPTPPPAHLVQSVSQQH
jgi:hypothetical protein